MVSTNCGMQRLGRSLLGLGLLLLCSAPAAWADDIPFGNTVAAHGVERPGPAAIPTAMDDEPVWDDDLESIIIIILEILGPHFRVAQESELESLMNEVIIAIEMDGVPSSLAPEQRALLHTTALAGRSLVAEAPASQQTATLAQFDSVLEQIVLDTESRVTLSMH